MKKRLLLLSLFFFFFTDLFGQTFGDSLSVKLEATVNAFGPSIDLNWPADADATSFIVYRKNKGGTSWGTALTTLPGTATFYSDNTVAVNTLYDYKVQMTSGGTPTKYGYLSSGIEVKANSNRGITLVVVESSYIANITFQNALDLFLEDLELDGWYPKLIYVTAADAVADVKADILAVYNENPTKTKQVILIGQVPVPHAGNLNPDGHPDHQGAWPADVFYGEVNGTWTDASVNNATSGNPLNHNVPGDGKYDQSYIPSDVDLQIGRIDLSNLPAFAESEEELLLRYFDKDHRFKTAQITVGYQGLIDDNFTTYDEGFSQCGWNNFSALVGRDNIVTGDYFGDLSYTTSTTGTYLWAYGCGGGTYTSAGGIGSTGNFPADSLSAVFSMLFGSYFGDWNYTNAFLRAPLAQGNTLTNCWAGRPNWYFNHMAMGENIGYSTRMTQNNNALFLSNVYSGMGRMVTIGLMGDPSLRMTYIPQPTNLIATENNGATDLTWSASVGGTETGYHVYRRYADSVDFVKLTPTAVSGTSFTDNSLPVAGTVYYYVKAVELEITPSGSYENESLGIRASDTFTASVETISELNPVVYPNPASNYLTIELADNLIGNSYQIVDLNGKIILEGVLSSSQLSLTISDFAKGTYVFSIPSLGISTSFVKN